MEAEQVKVNSLTHMVVVVDENSGESATAALEEQLQVSLVIPRCCYTAPKFAYKINNRLFKFLFLWHSDVQNMQIEDFQIFRLKKKVFSVT